MRDRAESPAAHRAAATFVVNSLGAKAQSVAEIESKLARRGVPSGVAASVIADAVRLGYLDDAALAAQLARGLRSRGFGRRRAASALSRRGLPAAVADEAIAAAFDGTDEVELARAALGSRSVDDDATRRRAAAFLTRRGFSTAAAWRAVRDGPRGAGD